MKTILLSSGELRFSFSGISPEGIIALVIIAAILVTGFFFAFSKKGR